MKWRILLWLGAWLGVALASQGCAPRLSSRSALGPSSDLGGKPAPGDIVRAYAAAIEHGESDAAFELLAPSLRGDMDRAAFRAYVERNHDELVAQARAAVDAVEASPAELHAVVRVDEQDVAVVRGADGAWRLMAPLFPRPTLASPSAALKALATALDAAASTARAPGDASKLIVPLANGGSVTLIREEAPGEPTRWRVKTLTPE